MSDIPEAMKKLDESGSIRSVKFVAINLTNLPSMQNDTRPAQSTPASDMPLRMSLIEAQVSGLVSGQLKLMEMLQSNPAARDLGINIQSRVLPPGADQQVPRVTSVHAPSCSRTFASVTSDAASPDPALTRDDGAPIGWTDPVQKEAELQEGSTAT